MTTVTSGVACAVIARDVTTEASPDAPDAPRDAQGLQEKAADFKQVGEIYVPEG